MPLDAEFTECSLSPSLSFAMIQDTAQQILSKRAFFFPSINCTSPKLFLAFDSFVQHFGIYLVEIFQKEKRIEGICFSKQDHGEKSEITHTSEKERMVRKIMI